MKMRHVFFLVVLFSLLFGAAAVRAGGGEYNPGPCGCSCNLNP